MYPIKFDSRIFLITLNLTLFSTYFLISKVKESYKSELEEFLKSAGYENYLHLLLYMGVYSKPLMAITPIPLFPAEVLRDTSFVASYRGLKVGKAGR